MGYYFVVARHNDNNFNKFLIPSLQRIGDLNCLECKDENNIPKNIYDKYNSGIIQLRSQATLKDDDILVFVHEDVNIGDLHFKEKVELLFNQKPEVGMIGVIGCSEFNDTCMWWNNHGKLRGHIIQGKDNSDEAANMIKENVGYYDDMMIIDGLIMIVRGKLINDGMLFDADNYKGFNDFYDINFCLDILTKTSYKIACADILVYHKSEGKGSMTDKWDVCKNRFIQKIEKMGLKFPLSVESIKQWKRDNNIPIQQNFAKPNDIIEIEI